MGNATLLIVLGFVLLYLAVSGKLDTVIQVIAGSTSGKGVEV